jgi:hypothetical protein
MRSGLRIFFAAALFACMSTHAGASPWAEVGDATLRSDIEVLAAAGVIDDVTTQWPLPWASIVMRLRDGAVLSGQPNYVRDAAQRVLAQAQNATRFNQLRVSALVDATNLPGVVHGFDGLGRGDGQVQFSAEYVAPTTAVRLALGAFTQDFRGRTIKFMPDQSYVAQKIGGAVLYGGYLSHWWGPGWVSALTLSNNARPFPQIGIARDRTTAFETPLLSWLGPWQAEFVVGLLDDQRVAQNTLWDGLRITFNPLPGLQLGIARTEELCGKGHPCKPLATYFDFRNDAAHPSRTASEGVFDIHYSRIAWGYPFEIYTQIMNEDSSPITHSGSSHLFGASVWLPINSHPLRLTFEYTDTISTQNIFSFGRFFYGVSYTDYKYPGDGMRYRGRALGFSLDSDSRLLSLQASYVDGSNWSYALSLHRAQISTPFTGPANIVTTAPVTVDLAEARLGLPLPNAKLDLALRLQDDQPRPQRGFTAAFETALRIAL